MREDGQHAKEACEATAGEKPAALVKRLKVSRHEAVAWGDPGRADEIEAGAGGRDGRAGPLEEVRKPRPQRPKRSHQRELRPLRLPELGQNPGNDGPWRKSIRLKTIPGLEKGVRAR